MSLPKLIGWVVIVFVLFTVISQPSDAAGITNHTLYRLHTAGNQMVRFVNSVADR